MIVYKDKTFCDFASCGNFNTCPLALTDDVKGAALRFGLPVALSIRDEDPECYVVPLTVEGGK